MRTGCDTSHTLSLSLSLSLSLIQMISVICIYIYIYILTGRREVGVVLALAGVGEGVEGAEVGFLVAHGEVGLLRVQQSFSARFGPRARAVQCVQSAGQGSGKVVLEQREGRS